MCRLCGGDRDKWEYEDFLKFFATLFGKIVKPAKSGRIYVENDLYNAIEDGTVRDVMEAAGYLYEKKHDLDFAKRIYNELVWERELWHAHPQPTKARSLIVAESTPWRFFHDFLRRTDFYPYTYVLVSDSSRPSYYIHVEHRPATGRTYIEEYGIADERVDYIPCKCNYDKLVVLCARCNDYVRNQQCLKDPAHKYFKSNLRCFKIGHQRLRKRVIEPETVSIASEVPSTVIEAPVKPIFNRNEGSRKSRRSPVQAVPPATPTPPDYSQVVKHPHPAENPFRPETPPVKILPPVQPIQVAPKEEEPPLLFRDDVPRPANIRDTYSPLPSPSPRSSPIPQDVVKLRPVFQPPPPPPHRDIPISIEKSPPTVPLTRPVTPLDTTLPWYNVLLLGPTTAGKSTWINGLANYLHYTTLPEAKRAGHPVAVIPARVGLSDRDGNSYTIKFGGDHSNEVYIDGQSSTQAPKQYRFRYSDAVINVIDTPGLDDIRGPMQDEYATRQILEEIQSLNSHRTADLHAIAIVVKADEPRLSASVEQAVVTLLGLFPKGAIPNLVFVFTYARRVNFSIDRADGLRAIQALFDKIELEHGTRLSLSYDTRYAVDNDAFSYLVVCAANRREYESLLLPQSDYEYGWARTQEESVRFFDFLRGVRSLPNYEVLYYNGIKDAADGLARQIIADGASTDARVVEAYETVIDYLNQEGIITIDHLWKELQRSGHTYLPSGVSDSLYLKNRRPRGYTLRKYDVYTALNKLSGLTIISTTLTTIIRFVTTIYETHRSSMMSDRYGYDEIALNDDYRLSTSTAPLRYSCYSEIREIRESYVSEKTYNLDGNRSTERIQSNV
uniref:AIG1-type G domain-containing protein n=1 Tax=Panagrellus redivivus TaxID=6233 RepID=A0A7E4VKK7_PANRE